MSNAKLARMLGVSEATISRVMNNQRGVADDTARRVREAASRLGLSPRRQGQPAMLRHNTIALLVLSGDVLQDYSWAFHQTLAGAEDALRSKGIELIYARSAEPSQIPRRLAAGQVDGAILSGTRPDAATLDALGSLPTVWVCSRHERDADTALAGNDAVAQIAASYLLDRGHRALAAINPMGRHPAVEARFDYFEFLATRRGADVTVFGRRDDDATAFAADDNPLQAMAAVVDRYVERMLVLSPRPTGVFAAIDLVSAMVYAALLKRGVRPGYDMEVIGCDNDGTALTGLFPRPATIDIAPFTMGRRAVEQLLWRIAHPDEESRIKVVVEPRLIAGEGVARP